VGSGVVLQGVSSGACWLAGERIAGRLVAALDWEQVYMELVEFVGIKYRTYFP
jgi:hypothetical protein